MKTSFNLTSRRTITEANINYYAQPFIHPARTMLEHDFIYLLDGEWKIKQNNEVYFLKKDTLLLLSAKNRHRGVTPCTAGTKTMYFHVAWAPGDFSGEDVKDPQLNQTGVAAFWHTALNPNIKKVFYEIVNAKLLGQSKKAAILFELLLCELLESPCTAPLSRTAEHIKDLIHQNPERFFSNTELARQAGVSLKSAETKFKAQFGVTIHQYMLQFKMNQAILLFKNFPEVPMKEIAYNLGFYDEYHFSKQFKKQTGLSPSAYKKRCL